MGDHPEKDGDSKLRGRCPCPGDRCQGLPREGTAHGAGKMMPDFAINIVTLSLGAVPR